MRLVNSGSRVQFTLRTGAENGFVIEVGEEANPKVVLDTITDFTAPVPEQQFTEEFDQACAAWLNERSNEELAALREEARRRYRHEHGTYVGTTDFGREAEARLDKIAEISGRRDVYIGHEPHVNRAIEGWFVFAPWLAEFCRERHYHKPSMQYALAFIDTAHRKAVLAPEEIRAFAVPDPLPEGSHWVADRAAGARGKEIRRVWSVESIGNGGHVVTWEDRDGCFHTTEDYNNIDMIGV
jgi:hypothetical protein